VGMKKDKNGKPPTPGAKGTDGDGNPLVLKAYAENTFGFLRITVSAKSIVAESIGIDEKTGKTSSLDHFTVNLAKHTVSEGGASKSRKVSRKNTLPVSATASVRLAIRSAAAKKRR